MLQCGREGQKDASVQYLDQWFDETSCRNSRFRLTSPSCFQATLNLLRFDTLFEPPRRVQVCDESLLVHEQRRKETASRDPDHDLPDEPRRLRERVPHLGARRRVQPRDGRDDGVCNLNALRERGHVVGGEIVQKDVLDDGLADDNTETLNRENDHIKTA